MKWTSEIFNGSFSAVSTATIARVGAFFSISRDLQDLHPFAPRRSQNFSKKSSEILARMNWSSFHSSRKSTNFVIFLQNFDEILSEFRAKRKGKKEEKRGKILRRIPENCKNSRYSDKIVRKISKNARNFRNCRKSSFVQFIRSITSLLIRLQVGFWFEGQLSIWPPP